MARDSVNDDFEVPNNGRGRLDEKYRLRADEVGGISDLVEKAAGLAQIIIVVPVANR